MNQLPIITGTVILAGAAAVLALCLLKVSLYTKTAAAVLSAVAVCGIFFRERAGPPGTRGLRTGKDAFIVSRFCVRRGI